MKKEIKDYLHLYLGCGCIMKGATKKDDWISVITWADLGYPHKVKALILRPLSSMTEEEDKECSNIMFGEFATKVRTQNITHYEGEKIRYLLSKGFDLFGLIDEGLAIEKTEVEKAKID